MMPYRRLLLACCFLLTSAAVVAQPSGFRSLGSDRATGDGPIEVIEFFWYGCGACYQFAPLVDAWKENLDDGVNFVRIPAVLNPNWRLHGQAFYTAEALGVTDQVHDRIFHSIHQQRRFLESQAEIRELFVSNGIDAEAFDEAWNSFAVDSQLRRAERLARQYQVRATPSIVVAGNYVSDPRAAGGLRELLDITDRLTAQLQAQ